MNVYQFNQKKYDDFFGNANVPDFVKLRAKENKDKGEVYTPHDIINKMLDMAKSEDWSNPDLTVLEQACGNGRFVIEMAKRFMDGLASVIPDENERFKHIMENILYACDIQMDSVVETYKNIEDIFGTDCLLGVKANIICTDALAFNWDLLPEVTNTPTVVYKDKFDFRNQTNIDLDNKIEKIIERIVKFRDEGDIGNVKVQKDKLDKATETLLDMYDKGEYQFNYEIMYYNYLHELNGLSPTSDESLSSCNGNHYTKYMIRVSN